MREGKKLLAFFSRLFLEIEDDGRWPMAIGRLILQAGWTFGHLPTAIGHQQKIVTCVHRLRLKEERFS